MTQHREVGPIVWSIVIAVTCLLLFALRSVLWLVVPCLLALIIYYGLRPAYKRLLLAGLGEQAAASVVIIGFALGSGLLLAGATPWMSARAESWQDAVTRYLSGGIDWLQGTLALLEAKFTLIRRLGLSATLSRELDQLTDEHAQAYGASLVVGLGTWVPALLLAPFLAFFFLRDGQAFERLLGRAVPNAYFERSLNLLHELDETAHAYFQGLLKLTVLDALALGLGLWLLGLSGAWLLGLLAAVLAWVPYVGSIVGCVIVVLVAATDFPKDPGIAYGAIALFIFVRLLDDFVFMPATIGRSLRVHPIASVLMLFVGGAIAGVAGLMLVLPLLGIALVVGETVGLVVTDPRLRARHAHARRLRALHASRDLA